MKIREMIAKLEMTLTRRNGEWAIAISPKNAPNAAEVRFIKSNRAEIIEELRRMRKEEIEQERLARENAPIKIKWRDGEILSGYTVVENKDLALELGLAKMIEHWGYLVDQALVDALGTEFSADDARAYLANKDTKKSEDEKENLAELQEQAKELNQRVKINSYPVPCDGSAEECDIDIITRYIDGQGKITVTRTHTH